MLSCFGDSYEIVKYVQRLEIAIILFFTQTIKLENIKYYVFNERSLLQSLKRILNASSFLIKLHELSLLYSKTSTLPWKAQ